LIVNAAGVRKPGHAEVIVRPPTILVADVSFAHVARHDEDFFGWPKNSGLAPCHMIPLDEPTFTLHELRCRCRDFGIAQRRCRCSSVAFPDQKAHVRGMG
jgi:hypothetical protein